jgi:phage gp29-like protein
LCKNLLDATLKGFAVAEVLWEVRDGKVLPRAVVPRDQRRFLFTVESELRLITREKMIEGEPLPPRKFIVHTYGGDDGSPYGLGVGNSLFWPVFFKRQDITFWLTFVDKFGSPTAVGKYPNGALKPEQDKLLRALGALSQDVGVIVPEGMVIELLEATRSGSIDSYEKLARYMDEQMSLAVLGETMSTTAQAAGMGSGQANVHNDVRIELAEDDSDELNETLNETLVRWIVELNMPNAGMPRLVRDFKEPEDLTARATRDKALTEMGFEPSDDYMLETYGEGWTKKAPAPAPDFSGMFGRPQAVGPAADDLEEDPAFAEGSPLSKGSSQRAFNAVRQQEIVNASEALAENWQALMGKRVENLLSVLDETGDLAQFRERMAQLVDAPPDDEAVEAIARAGFAGHLLGRGAAPKPSYLSKLRGLLGRRKG